MRIQQLSPKLTQQIAAGEVIERPASVIKELLENSFDAGAKNIHVHLVKSGKQCIQIQDDGCGIDKEDLALALACHATSKIRQLDDLENIASLGFRGEALASIAAISRLTLTSRTAEATQAWQIQVAGEDMQANIKPAAHPIGTMIRVEDLFFNTPARRRFLRADKTEYQHIETMLKSLALSHFDVAFKLQHNDRQIFHYKPAPTLALQERRVQQVCGHAFLQQALRIDFAATGLSLSGWLGAPEIARSQSDLQFFYLNGRLIRDKIILHAIRQAYSDYLEPGRQPAYVLYLNLDPRSVDVNVHPTKHEVRFHESRLVHDFVVQSLQKALQPETSATMPAAPEPEITSHNAPAATATPSTYSTSQPIIRPQHVEQKLATYGALLEPATSEIATMAVTAKQSLAIKSVLHQRYVILETETGFSLIDYPAVQRHIALKKLQTETVKPTPLLIPQTWQSDETEIERIIQLKNQLKQYGIDIERLTPTTLVCRHVPNLLIDFDFKDFCQRLLNNDAILEHACAASFKTKPVVDDTQLRNTLERLATENPELLEDTQLVREYVL